MPGDEWQRFANARAYYGFMWGHPGKKLLFMGQEFGQTTEWNFDADLPWWLLDHPPHQGLQAFVRDLNRLYRDHAGPSCARLRGRGLSLDRRQRRRTVGAGVPALRRRGRPAGRGGLQLHPGAARRLPDRSAGRRALARRPSTPTRRFMAARASAISAASSPKRGRLHGLPASAVLTLPPLATVFLEFESAMKRARIGRAKT